MSAETAALVREVVEHHRTRLLALCAEMRDDPRFVSGAAWGVHALDRALLAADGETDRVRLGLDPAPATPAPAPEPSLFDEVAGA